MIHVLPLLECTLNFHSYTKLGQPQGSTEVELERLQCDAGLAVLSDDFRAIGQLLAVWEVVTALSEECLSPMCSAPQLLSLHYSHALR